MAWEQGDIMMDLKRIENDQIGTLDITARRDGEYTAAEARKREVAQER